MKKNESRKRSPYVSFKFESEMAAAKAALRDAARTLAVLAREEPRLIPPPPESPEPPFSPQKVIRVHPTGHHKLDVENLESAIMRAGPGGMVLLKATNKLGKPMHFNLTKVDELFMEHEVTLKSEKNALIRFND